MKQIIDSIWCALEEEAKYLIQKDKNIVFDLNKKDDFSAIFQKLYYDIKNNYMKDNVTALDRHKVAAIIIVSLLESKIISYKKSSEKIIFLGNEMVATEIALSWMCQNLEDKLKNIGINTNISHYIMPDAFACDTPYFEIFSRNLYFAQNKYTLNPLDIAEKLFLLEYITIINEKIDPKVLQE